MDLTSYIHHLVLNMLIVNSQLSVSIYIIVLASLILIISTNYPCLRRLSSFPRPSNLNDNTNTTTASTYSDKVQSTGGFCSYYS